MNLTFGRKNLIGTDIGSYAVKVVRLKGGGGSYSLDTALSMRVPREGGAELPVSRLLADFLKTNRVAGREAAAAIAGPSLIFRHLTLPLMPEKDMDEAVGWEIRKEIGVPASEVVTDYVASGRPGAAEGGKQPVIAFAARRGDVDEVISLFDDSGLELRAINVIPAALLAVFDENNDWETGVSYAMVEMGETSSVLAILKDRLLVFTREISFGGGDLTRAIAEALNMGTDEAERYKEAHGLDVASVGGHTLKETIDSIVERLCTEIHRSVDYYQAQFSGEVPGRIFLSGGTASLKGLDDVMTNSLGLPCFIHDPFRRIIIPSSIDSDALRLLSPSMNVAAGLAVQVEP